jgi:NAD(P)-dependent dehydrogenase (short-subunit alcohol dehydrogenase family)
MVPDICIAQTSERLNKLGPGKCEYIVADLKDKAGCQKLCDELKKRTDRLTVLINNSGASWGAPYDDFPESGWDKLMALNVKAIYYGTQHPTTPVLCQIKNEVLIYGRCSYCWVP